MLPKAKEWGESIRWMGIKVHNLSAEDIHAYVKKGIQEGTQTHLAYLNVRSACLAWKVDWLRSYYASAGLVYCDGDGIRWAMKILKQPIPQKIPLTRWLWQFAEYCEKESFSFFFLGSQPGVAETAANNLKAKYPDLKVVGTQHGYYDHTGDENQKVIERINELKPHILLVSFGTPEQERWLRDNAPKLNVNILMTGGGVLDYAAGKLGKAPKWMIRCQVEWAFRIWQEPKRLFFRYFLELPLFFMKVIAHRLFGADSK